MLFLLQNYRNGRGYRKESTLLDIKPSISAHRHCTIWSRHSDARHLGGGIGHISASSNVEDTMGVVIDCIHSPRVRYMSGDFGMGKSRMKLVYLL